MTDLRRKLLRTLIAPASLCLLPLGAEAVDLPWPNGAELVLQSGPTTGSLQVATGPFADGAVPSMMANGALTQQIWQIPAESGDPATLAGLLHAQLLAEGFDILLACEDRICGGFDFRYALPIAGGPEMHVDLGHFRYISAVRDEDEGTTHLAITLSHGGRQAYAHLAMASPEGALPPPVTTSSLSSPPGAPTPGEDVIDSLLAHGRAVLHDLRFETGASTLSDAMYDTLVQLAGFLADHPTRQVVLVGHTDAEGSLEANITLSETRARAVRQVLIDRMQVDPAQVRAEGVGFLAPIATNATPAGRDANRRVEVVLADMD